MICLGVVKHSRRPRLGQPAGLLPIEVSPGDQCIGIVRTIHLGARTCVTTTKPGKCAVQCTQVLLGLVQCGAVDCYAVLWSVIQCGAVLCSAVQCTLGEEVHLDNNIFENQFFKYKKITKNIFNCRKKVS